MHHRHFATFVLKGAKNHIVEIGGNGILYDIIREKGLGLNYSVLDICEPTIKRDNITYLLGNCEQHKFIENEEIVMSHVFEHLFSPRKFIENIRNCRVQTIYISIPNMLYLIDSGNNVVLHNEHTYYIDKSLIEWLFLEYDYFLEDLFEFNNHSLFLKFKKCLQSKRSDLIRDISITDKILKSINPLFNFKIKENSFICPAGLYGQLLMYYFKDVKILGFLDNDKTKQNLRVYGTPYFVYSFDRLLELDNVTIYLIGGLYNAELIKQINDYNKNYEIIEI